MLKGKALWIFFVNAKRMAISKIIQNGSDIIILVLIIGVIFGSDTPSGM